MSFALRTFILCSSAGFCATFAACSASSTAGSPSEGADAGGEDSGLDIGSGDGDSGVGPIEFDPTTDPNFSLPAPPNCGDGSLDDDEVCDDGGTANDDGCYANCLGVYPGYICANPGEACFEFAVCGDGVKKFPEQCDDGNLDPSDGCSDNCKVEIGWKCPPSESCSETTCGDGLVEGAEMCEPSLTPGCTAQCQFAPDCSGDGACTSACGDGLVLNEECDDGNRQNGDGCSSDCKEEPGYWCSNESTSGDCERSPHTGECILKVPVVYRDFAYSHESFNGGQAPTFMDPCGNLSPGDGVTLGMVQPQLSGGKPVGTSGAECSSSLNAWYADNHANVHNGELVLYQGTEGGSFVNRWGAQGEQFLTTDGWSGVEGKNCKADDPCGPYDGTPFFYPIDGMADPADDVRFAGALYDGAGKVYGGVDKLLTEQVLTGASPMHNYGFTSEITYWFGYDEKTNAKFDFVGDDDVWVFVNGKLALDLGGKHPAAGGSFTLSGGSATIEEGTGAAHGMITGNVYEVKVFHAERAPNGSTFKLTLSGFDTSRSDCRPICGDGIVAFGEECDGGEDATGGYNQCSDECTLGSYCGDGTVDEGEQCDDADPNGVANCTNCRVVVIR